MEKRPRRRRHLSPEERALWSKVAETVSPLPGKRLPEVSDPPPSPAEPPWPANSQKPFSRRAVPPKPAPPPLAPIENTIARALRRGAEVDARLDLHGLRQAEAHARLTRFILAQQAAGAKTVLVITGKGRPDERAPLFEERGVLRRLVPAWLADPALRSAVIGFSEAAPAHGGGGALYVRLRRSR